MSDSNPSIYRPLFRLDPGWPFVLAGLALLVAGILIPAQRELHELRGQQQVAEATEARVYARLEAYDRFLTDLRAGDPDLVRRLAIANLNMVPKGEQSLLLTPGLNQTVAQWIDESVPPVTLTPEPYPDTLLGRLAVGPNRLWMLAASVFLLFIGLLFGPDPVRSSPSTAARGEGDPDGTDGGPATATAERGDGRMVNAGLLPAAAASAGDADEDADTDAVALDDRDSAEEDHSEGLAAADVAEEATEDATEDGMGDDDEYLEDSAEESEEGADDEDEAEDGDVIDVEVIDEVVENRSPEELDQAFSDRVRASDTDRPIAPPKGAD